jgi:hypothetical protein
MVVRWADDDWTTSLGLLLWHDMHAWALQQLPLSRLSLLLYPIPHHHHSALHWYLRLLLLLVSSPPLLDLATAMLSV